MSKKRRKKQRIISVKAGFVYLGDDGIAHCSVDKNGKLTINSSNGELPLFEVTVESSYDRENKNPKTLLKIPNSSGVMNINKALSEYDILFSIDTNTQKVNNAYHSIGVIVKGEFIEKKNSLKVRYSEFGSIKSINECLSDHIEHYHWMNAIEAINKIDEYKSYNKIGLIVDCDLGNLVDYNLSNKPIISGYYLPQNYYLIYASSDAGAEYLPNKMIRMSDKLASEKLKKVISKDESKKELT